MNKDCRWGKSNGYCGLTDKEAQCENCDGFDKKPVVETPKERWKLSVSWFDEDFSPSGDDGDFEYTYFSEPEAREFLAKFIKANPKYEIWWSLYKVETIAEGHLERRG